VLGGFVALLAVLEARLVQLQIVRHAAAEKMVEFQSEEKIKIAPPRGAILDRFGHSLAVARRFPSVYLDPKMARREDAPAIAAALELPLAAVMAALSGSGHFVWLRRPASEAQWLALVDQQLPGVGMVEESGRSYPQGALAGSLLGRVGMDNTGLAGLEYLKQGELAGDGSEMLARRDARGRLTDWRVVHAGRDGDDLRLTLDEALQFRAEQELAKAVKASGARGGVVAVMVPSTGEMLAMASDPAYDPATGGIPHDAVAEMAYEPGSTFKAFTMITALNEGKTHAGELIDCQMGKIEVNGQVIHDHKPFGVLPIEKVMAESSDVGVIKLGLRVGNRRFSEYLHEFGFGARTRSGLPGESAGILSPVEQWSGRSLASMAMGQEIAVSPLQLLSAYSAIANGGRLLQPRVFLDTPVIERARWQVKPEVLAQVREMLAGVVETGTGKKAALPGVRIAGKTGTAQKAQNGHYLQGRYVASFIGFFPLENPVAVALVVIDEPKGAKYHGGDVAAPVFSALAQDIYVRALAARDTAAPVPAAPRPARGAEPLQRAELAAAAGGPA
jgi:cell division protein FtsI/penicillin-binding protein 2